LVELKVFFEGDRILPESETKGMVAGTGRRSGTPKPAGQRVREVAGDGPRDPRRRSSSQPTSQI
jgi:hypothetical protein